MRYDGKAFAYWQTYCRTELNPARRIEALKALATFGVNGYAEEAAAAIMEVAASYYGELGPNPTYGKVMELTSQDTISGKVVCEACEAVQRIGSATAPVLLNGLDEPGARLFCERVLNNLEPNKAIVTTLVRRGIDGPGPERQLMFQFLLHHFDSEGAAELLSEALDDEPKVRAFVSLVLEECKGSWDSKANAWSAQLLALLKPHARVVVPLLVARLNELKEARAAEVEQAAKTVAAQELGYQQMPQAVSSGAIRINTEPETPDTRLKRHLANLESSARTASTQLVEILGIFGPAAKDALPVLHEASADPCTALQQAATTATRQVEQPPK
jgi:hypothetical protein